jgi:hypothetical protein
MRLIGHEHFDELKYEESTEKYHTRHLHKKNVPPPGTDRPLEESRMLRETRLKEQIRDQVRPSPQPRPTPQRRAIKSLVEKNEYGRLLSRGEKEEKPWNRLFNKLVVDNQSKMDQIHYEYYRQRKANSHNRLQGVTPVKHGRDNIRVPPRLSVTKTAVKVTSEDMQEIIRLNQAKALRQEHLDTRDMFGYLERRQQQKQAQDSENRVKELEALLGGEDEDSRMRLLRSIESVKVKKEARVEEKIRELIKGKNVTSKGIENLKQQIFE